MTRARFIRCKVPEDRYAFPVFVVRTKDDKEDAEGGKVQADNQPVYRMKPKTEGIKRAVKR